MRCGHPTTRQVTPDRCYSHPVARPPKTFENPAAHGGIAYLEECTGCGSQRAVNQNGRHLEYGPWVATANTPA